MSGQNFAVVFSGKLSKSAEQSFVQRNLASLFKLNEAQSNALFTGKTIAIKKNLELAMAIKVVSAMKRAGAVGHVYDVANKCVYKASQQPVAQSSAKPNAPKLTGLKAKLQKATSDAQLNRDKSLDTVKKIIPQEVASSPATEKDILQEITAASGIELSRATLDQPGVRIVKQQAVTPANINTHGIQIAELGAVVDKTTVKEAPIINTDGLKVAAVGETMDKIQDQLEPDIDISAYNMSIPGEQLVERKAEEEINIDLSGLSMSPPGEQIVAKPDVDVVDIDTHHLSVE